VTLAARKVAADCDGQPVRHSPGGLRGESFDEERLNRWMLHWAKVRHDHGAERTFLAALDSSLIREALNRLMFGSLADRNNYSNFVGNYVGQSAPGSSDDGVFS
jgi:hypothetical protein